MYKEIWKITWRKLGPSLRYLKSNVSHKLSYHIYVKNKIKIKKTVTKPNWTGSFWFGSVWAHRRFGFVWENRKSIGSVWLIVSPLNLFKSPMCTRIVYGLKPNTWPTHFLRRSTHTLCCDSIGPDVHNLHPCGFAHLIWPDPTYLVKSLAQLLHFYFFFIDPLITKIPTSQENSIWSMRKGSQAIKEWMHLGRVYIILCWNSKMKRMIQTIRSFLRKARISCKIIIYKTLKIL